MTDEAWIHALRTSHDRLTGLLADLGDGEVTRPSYAAEWSVADVASHVGSQAEIFGRILDAGLAGEPAPGGDTFAPIWDRWNAMSPDEQARESAAANEALVARIEGLSPQERDGFSLELFGSPADFGGFASMRLSEHALHTWDVAVSVDPAATVDPGAAALLVDAVPRIARFAQKKVDGGGVVAVETSGPERRFVIDLDEGVLLDEAAESEATLTMPAEAFLRLVYGRLDPDHTPGDVVDEAGRLDPLRAAFPGF